MTLESFPFVPIDRDRLLDCAADLLSVDGENPEYDRALVELTGDLLGYTADEYPQVREELKRRLALAQARP